MSKAKVIPINYVPSEEEMVYARANRYKLAQMLKGAMNTVDQLCFENSLATDTYDSLEETLRLVLSAED
jgi:hypothetical protein